MSELSSYQFRDLLNSGKVKNGKKGRISIIDQSDGAISKALEQVVEQSKDRALKALKSKTVKIPRKEAFELTQMKFWLTSFNIPFTSELQFAKPRKFRFDIAIPSKMIAIEYEGINAKKSRHTTITGFTKDCEKYNLAVSLGWKVYRYTALNYKNIHELIKELV